MARAPGTASKSPLTPLGHRYAEQAARLRSAFDEAQHSITDGRSEIQGLLRITSATTFGEVLLVDLISDFQQRYPQVDVEIDMSIVTCDLLDGRFDFAFRITGTIKERFVARAVGLVREIAVIGLRLSARYTQLRNPTDLVQLPALRHSHFRDDAEWVFVRGRGSQTVRLHSPLAINNFSAILHATELGIGAARLPRYLVHDALREGCLHLMLPDWEIAQLPIYLVYPQR